MIFIIFLALTLVLICIIFQLIIAFREYKELCAEKPSNKPSDVTMNAIRKEMEQSK